MKGGETLTGLKGNMGRGERGRVDFRGQESGAACGGRTKRKETKGSCLVPQTEMNDTCTSVSRDSTLGSPEAWARALPWLQKATH